ncbi:MAG: peptidoglycan DD-metalloendopeptidase family protein [Sphingomicrobium sp.]
MARRGLILIPALVFLAAPSSPPAARPDEMTIDKARAELKAAAARSALLRQSAEKAAGTLTEIRARQRAAGSDLDTAEARITLAGLQLEQAERAAMVARTRLRQAQRPAASLLAGLAMMGRRPPLLAFAHEGGVDAIVRTRILLDATLPAIRQRAGVLAADLARSEQLAATTRKRRIELQSGKAELIDRRRAFAALEQRALALTAAAGGAALDAGDEALSAGEALDRMRSAEVAVGTTRTAAIEIARGPAVPARPGSADGPMFRAPFAYQLPAAEAVTQGLGAIDSNGVRSRGLTLATTRGTPLFAPASGTLRFAGAFRGFDGVLIIDHGGGWVSLMVNAASPLKAGQRVAIGDPVGRALGPLMLELSQGGKRHSPALIAGSSPPLSNRRKGG